MEDDTSTKAKQAAEEMVEQDRRLPGEPTDSNYLEDARYWLKVYQELVDTKIKVIKAITRPLDHLTPPARAEIEETDLRALEAELERLQARVKQWSARSSQLQV